MTPVQNAYRRSTATQWTRVDLLVALYAATQRALEECAATLDLGDTTAWEATSLRSRKLLLALLEGIQPEADGSSGNIRRLLVFCHGCLTQPSAEACRDAARIVGTLHSAFATIQDEARLLEQRGEIPPLDEPTGRTVVA
jgi:hypothetical protein